MSATRPLNTHPPARRLHGGTAYGLCRFVWVAGLSMVYAVLPGAALADDDVVAKRMSIERVAGQLTLTFDATEFGSGTLLRKLKTGLPQDIVVRAYAYRERTDKPLSITVQTCRVIYDLWGGTYHVDLKRPDRASEVELRSPREVIRACLYLTKLPFEREPLEQLRGTRVYCAVLVELNPISQDTVERIRRWLSGPSSGGQLRGDAFFGSFVSIFVSRDIGTAERTAAYRSQAWTVP